MRKFPKNFLWGAATSSYQVEGGNSRADWWEWEKEAGKEKSGAACRHYQRYPEDFKLAKNLCHNAHRLSIEWSRIEPEEGKFSRKEIQHYVRVILELRKHRIEPIVTLHHFTNPAWFARGGGWSGRKAAKRFERYAETVVRALAPYVHYWVTINEPTIYISHAFIFGVWPPQEKSYVKAMAVTKNLFAAHQAAYGAIRRIYRQVHLPAPEVGIAQNMMAFVPSKHDFKNQLAAYLRGKVYNFGLLDRMRFLKVLDFIGVNYYSRQMVDLSKLGIRNLAMDVEKNRRRNIRKNSLGWDIYPKGLYEILLALKKYKLPVLITENGICTENDKLRWSFIREHLGSVHRAIRQGVGVIGYLYWSLLDNFEWDKGFAPRFGLIKVDYKTFRRTVRKSARKFARVCRTGLLA